MKLKLPVPLQNMVWGGQYKKVINSNLLVLGHRLHIIDNIAV